MGKMLHDVYKDGILVLSLIVPAGKQKAPPDGGAFCSHTVNPQLNAVSSQDAYLNL